MHVSQDFSVDERRHNDPQVGNAVEEGMMGDGRGCLLIQAVFSELQRAGVVVKFSGQGNLSPVMLFTSGSTCTIVGPMSVAAYAAFEALELAEHPGGHSRRSWNY